MPQLQILPDRPQLVGVRLTITDRMPDLDPTWRFDLEVRGRDQDWRTLRSDLYMGRMLDYASTWGSELVSCFLFEEGGEDLFRTGRALHRAARQHHQESYD